MFFQNFIWDIIVESFRQQSHKQTYTLYQQNNEFDFLSAPIKFVYGNRVQLYEKWSMKRRQQKRCTTVEFDRKRIVHSFPNIREKKLPIGIRHVVL